MRMTGLSSVNGMQSARDFERMRHLDTCSSLRRASKRHLLELGGHLIAPRILIVFAAAAGIIAATSAPLVTAAEDSELAQLWQNRAICLSRDLFHGPWGRRTPQDPAATYTFTKPKEGGVNPGVIVRDSHGRTWHVKQSPLDDDKASSIDVQGAEGPVEVTVSRSPLRSGLPPAAGVLPAELHDDRCVRHAPAPWRPVSSGDRVASKRSASGPGARIHSCERAPTTVSSLSCSCSTAGT
jgi:hypothetical protein